MHKAIKRTSALLLYCTVPTLSAETITIHNKAPHIVYAAIYYGDQGIFSQAAPTNRATDVYKIAPYSDTSVERPARKLGYDRNLYVSTTNQDLTDTLDGVAQKTIASINVGTSRGSSFYITQQAQTLTCYNSLTWYMSTTQTSIQQVFDAINYLISSLIGNISGRGSVAAVRTSAGMSAGEASFCTRRDIKTHTALEALLQQSITTSATPRIAIAASGGGTRAMVATLGFLAAAQDIGLLDTATYLSSISGSTWCIAPWLASGLSLSAYKDQLIPRVAQGLIHDRLGDSVSHLTQLIESLLTKYHYQQRITSVDIFGVLLAQELLLDLTKNVNQLTLSDQLKAYQDGSKPYPLYHTVMPNGSSSTYTWLTCTPDEVGLCNQSVAIPSWGAGRLCKRGYSVDFAPEPTLGFWMGTWGSAYTANLHELLELLKDQLSKSKNIYELIAKHVTEVTHKAAPSLELFINILEQAVQENDMLNEIRISPARINNFMAGMTQTPWGTPDELTLIDAGFACNIPVPSLLSAYRNVDVIIILDSSDIHGEHTTALQRAAQYTRDNSLPFPDIPAQPYHTPCTVFSSPDPAVPTVIYLMLPEDFISVHPYSSTLNFEYTPQEFELLYDTAYDILTHNSQTLIDTLRMVTTKKQKSFKASFNYWGLSGDTTGEASTLQQAGLLYYLGHLYLMGEQVTADYQKARANLEKAYQQKISPWIRAAAAYDLGHLYEYGLGVDINYDTAIQYYMRAASQQANPAIRDQATKALERLDAHNKCRNKIAKL